MEFLILPHDHCSKIKIIFVLFNDTFSTAYIIVLNGKKIQKGCGKKQYNPDIFQMRYEHHRKSHSWKDNIKTDLREIWYKGM
jgi:hypothetical protein